MEMEGMSEHWLRTKYGYKPPKKRTLRARLRSKAQCNLLCIKTVLTRFIPILTWLPKYHFPKYILGDIISGCTTAIVRIPQGLAYGLLAGLQPINGLYTGFFSPLVYAIFGTSQHISVGVFSIVSLMLGSALDKFPLNVMRSVAPTAKNVSFTTVQTVENASVTLSYGFDNTTNSLSSDQDTTAFTNDQAFAMISSLTVLIGLILLMLGICRLGIVAMFLSDPVVSAFTTGAAIYVVTAQMKYLTGIPLQRKSGAFALILTYVELFSRISEIQWSAVVTSAICLSVLVPIKYVNRTYKEKLKSIPIPVELFIVILGTTVSSVADLNEKYNLRIVGPVPSGMPTPVLPQPSFWPHVLSDAISIAIVIFAVSVSMGKIFAKKHGYKIYPNQELIALGLCQVTAGCFRGHAGGGALARSSVQESSGGKTQVAAFVSCVIILLVLLVIGPLFETLPVACLSCIILANLHGLLMQFERLPELWRLDVYDFAVWLLTFCAVILFGVDLGLGAGLVFSLCCGGLRASQVSTHVLGELVGTDLFRDVRYYEAANESYGVKVVQFTQSPTYANKSSLQRIPDLLVEEKKNSEIDPTENDNAEIDLTELTSDKQMPHTKIVLFDCKCWSVIDTVGMSTLKQVIRDIKAANMQVYLASLQESLFTKLSLCGIINEDEPLVKVYPTLSYAMEVAKTALQEDSSDPEMTSENSQC